VSGIDKERVVLMSNKNNKIVLLVEDEVIIAMTEKMELEEYGYTVHHVTTGEKAVQTIIDNIHPVDIILMDINLGSGIDGTQAAEQILDHKDIPLIFVSSHTEPEIVEKTEKITSYGYVVKNSGITVLDASIKMAFKLFDANVKWKQIELSLRASEVQYRRLFESAKDGILILDVNTGIIVDVNPFMITLLGYTYEQFLGKTIWDIGFFINIIRNQEKFKELVKNGYVRYEHLPLETAYQKIVYVEFISNVYLVDDKKVIQCNIREISERKQMERQLQAEKDNLRITLNSIGDAVISTDNQGRIARMNPVAEILCGWKEAEACGKKLEEVFYIVNTDTRERVDTSVESVMRTGTVVGLANHTLLLSKDGKEYQIADSAAPITTNEGDITGVVLVFRDVTDQYEKDRLLEERVKELNCLYKIGEIVEKPGILLKDILQETAEIIPQSWRYPEICEARITLHGQTFQTTNFTRTKWCLSNNLFINGVVSGEVTVCYREEKPTRDEGPFQKEERRLLDAVAKSLGKILELRQAKEALKESEARFRVSQEMSPDGFTILHPLRNDSGEIIDFVWIFENSTIARINGTDPQEVIGKQLLHLFPNHRNTPVFEAYIHVANSGETQVIEEIPVGDILVKPIWLRLVIVSTGTDITIFAQDITERKLAKEEINRQLSEKETLLKEVHHRIKNNMATIESLLSLQIRSTENPDVKTALGEAKFRAQSIRVLYEKFLISKDYQDISVKKYTENLIDAIVAVFAMSDDVTIEKQITDFKLNTKKLIPLGFIINELFTNVFKYAFKDRDKGKVSISIEKNENTVTVIIQDNGIGIDERILENKLPGFGLTIVKMLVEQLNGAYSIMNENGTKITIQFEI